MGQQQASQHAQVGTWTDAMLSAEGGEGCMLTRGHGPSTTSGCVRHSHNCLAVPGQRTSDDTRTPRADSTVGFTQLAATSASLWDGAKHVHFVDLVLRCGGMRSIHLELCKSVQVWVVPEQR